MAVESLARHGFPSARHFAWVAIQGPATAGTHGCGVSTPKAAAVAAATVGLPKDEHIPQPEILTLGAKSCIVATGFPSASTILCEVTLNVAGVVPKGHSTVAPAATIIPINILLSQAIPKAIAVIFQLLYH
jgi:hypothetical protein